LASAPRNPVIAPVPVLAGHANDQLLDLTLDPRSARASTGLRSIEFAGDKLAIPAQDGVRSGYSGDVGENLAAQAMTDLAERASLGVRELQPTCQLRLDDAVLGGQIFIPGQQLLIHCSRYVGQDTRPIHNRPLPRPSAKGVVDYLTNCTGPPPDTDLPTLPKGPASLPFQFFGLTG
jgi:hypothetical protein